MEVITFVRSDDSRVVLPHLRDYIRFKKMKD